MRTLLSVAAIIVCSLAGSALAAGPAASSDAVPLTVWEQGGAARTGDCATGGIPLPEGAVSDLSQLRVVDANGAVLPAQFAALDRWWTSPNKAVRWCLVSFPATVAAGGNANYTLKLPGTGAVPPVAPATALKVEDGPDAVTVITGPLKFRVSKKNFNLFDGVWLDPAGGLKFGEDCQVVAPGNDGGITLTTGEWADEQIKAGDRYSSAAGAPSKVTIEENGPVRACIFVQGSHLPAGPNEFAPGVYDYKVRIYAYAGQPYVRVFYTLANSRLDPVMRSWPIETLTLTTKLAGGVKTAAIAGVKDGVDLDLAGGRDVVVTQTVDDSSNPQRLTAKGPTPTWTLSRNKKAEGQPGGVPVPGAIDIRNDKFGLAVGLKYFAEMCPKGLAADATGVSVGLFPKTDKTYYILPGRKRMHELVYLFHSTKPTDSSPWALKTVTGLKNQELRPVAPATWYQSSRAWFGGMGIVDPKICPHAQTVGINPTGLYATWYGYGFFGRDWNSGGQHPHHDSAIWPWVLGGGSDQSRYVEAEALCRWIADLGVGSVLDVPTDYSVLNKEQWADKKLNDFFVFMGDTNYDNADARFQARKLNLHYKTYPGGPTKLNSGGPFELIRDKIDSGHMGLIGLDEFYRLTGDRDVLETIDTTATMARSLIRLYVGPPAITEFVEKDNPEDPNYKTQDRYIGWPLYEMADAYARTGNPVFAKEMSVIVRALRNRARTSPVGFIAITTVKEGKSGYEGHFTNKEGAAQVDAIFQTAIAAHGLARYTLDTGDFEGLDTLTAFAENITHFSMVRDADQLKGWFYCWSDYWTNDKSDPFLAFGSSNCRVYRPLSVAYDLTGRADYRAISAAAAAIYGPPKKLSSDMGLEMQGFLYPYQCPKPNATPPAAVKDLKAEAVGGGQVKLTWTAPAMSAASGANLAARYQVKYSADPIVERVGLNGQPSWPDRTPPLPQTAAEWEARTAAFMAKFGRPFWSAINLPDLPTPAAAGATESFVAKGLPAGKGYFALKSYDRAHNQSELSNVVAVEVK